MPFRIIIAIVRKPGLTPTQFKDHCESHTSLVKSLSGSLCPTSHTRHYIARIALNTTSSDTTNTNYPASMLFGIPTDVEYDVLAVLEFKDQEAFGAFIAHTQQPEIKAKLDEDQEKFADRGKTKIYVIEDVRVNKWD